MKKNIMDKIINEYLELPAYLIDTPVEKKIIHKLKNLDLKEKEAIDIISNFTNFMGIYDILFITAFHKGYQKDINLFLCQKSDIIKFRKMLKYIDFDRINISNVISDQEFNINNVINSQNIFQKIFTLLFLYECNVGIEEDYTKIYSNEVNTDIVIDIFKNKTNLSNSIKKLLTNIKNYQNNIYEIQIKI